MALVGAEVGNFYLRRIATLGRAVTSTIFVAQATIASGERGAIYRSLAAA